MGEHVFDFYDRVPTVFYEAYNTLSANIQFGSTAQDIKTLSIVSAIPREGRTTVAINLAISFAHDGKKVLLVDSDFRKPGMDRKFENRSIKGLANYISMEVPFTEIVYPTNFEGMSYVPCGLKTLFPFRMLTSEGFDRFIQQARDSFDYVIFDTPSINSVIDASILAAKTDGTIMVVASGNTSHKNFRQAREQLLKVNARILGVIVNKLPKCESNKYIEYYSALNAKKQRIKGKE